MRVYSFSIRVRSSAARGLQSGARRHRWRRGKVDLSVGSATAGQSGVDVLLRDQAAFGFGGGYQPVMGDALKRKARLGASQFGAASHEFRFRAASIRDGMGKVGVHFRDLEDRQQLAFAELVTHLDGDFPQVTRYFRVQIHLLVGAELAGERDLTGKTLTPRLGYGDDGWGRGNGQGRRRGSVASPGAACQQYC